MPLVQTRGAASAQGFGEFAQVTAANYIEDVFSTYLFVGTQTTTTITNGIDLSGKGGLVWLKDRTGAGNHTLGNTARSGNYLYSNNTDAESSVYPFAFTSTGFTLNGALLDAGRNFVTWTFRKQPKFFDIVTFSGNGGTQNIAHNLGSVPGCVIVKFVSGSAGVGNWPTWHRGLSSGNIINLNLTGGEGGPFPTYFGNNTITVDPTSTQFTVGSNANVNASGSNYIAYIFAHDAGGFGLTGTDNVISCGSWTGNATFNGSATVNLGYEPQFLMWKNSSADSDWFIQDNMRGFTAGSTNSPASPGAILSPNSSAAEVNPTTGQSLTSTGFALRRDNSAGNVYIYIAIRRGPMKVPTTGTSVYNAVSRTGTDATATINSVITPDLWLIAARSGDLQAQTRVDRLRGDGRFLNENIDGESTTTVAQLKITNGMTSVSVGSGATWNASASTFINWFFRRAPSFFDEVCYTGTGSARTLSHNLAAVPELMIVKKRSGAEDWAVYTASQGNTKFLVLQSTSAVQQSSPTNETWNDTTPTTSVFSVGTGGRTNDPSQTYVAYLFATCAGVSKVGSYTGTGTTLQINCGFTGGARFVLIKRTDSTGDWYVWDSARGIIPSNDPYLLINNTAAEVTGTDYVDTYAAGFEISSTAPAAINASAGTFIFLAIA
jgi:hypothetical protein